MSKARNVPLYSKNWLLDSFRVRQRVSAVFSGQSSTFLFKYEVELDTFYFSNLFFCKCFDALFFLIH